MTALALADALTDALCAAGLVSGAFGQENKIRRVLAEKLEELAKEKRSADPS